jgi:hypothetical protein
MFYKSDDVHVIGTSEESFIALKVATHATGLNVSEERGKCLILKGNNSRAIG